MNKKLKNALQSALLVTTALSPAPLLADNDNGPYICMIDDVDPMDTAPIEVAETADLIRHVMRDVRQKAFEPRPVTDLSYGAFQSIMDTVKTDDLGKIKPLCDMPWESDIPSNALFVATTIHKTAESGFSSKTAHELEVEVIKSLVSGIDEFSFYYEEDSSFNDLFTEASAQVVTPTTIKKPESNITATMIDSEIALIRIKNFATSITDRLNDVITQLETQNNPAGYILDLRDNYGGLRNEAVDMANLFLENGHIMTTKGNKGTTTHFATKGDVLNGKPLVLLTNDGSASASEILVAALQDNGRATLMGQTTYGKGVSQSVTDLVDYDTDHNGSYKITSEVFLRKNKNPIHHVGVAPDIFVQSNSLDIPQDSKIRPIQTTSACLANNNLIEDLELDCALDFLKNQELRTKRFPLPKAKTAKLTH